MLVQASQSLGGVDFLRDVEVGARLGTWPRGSTVLGAYHDGAGLEDVAGSVICDL